MMKVSHTPGEEVTSPEQELRRGRLLPRDDRSRDSKGEEEGVKEHTQKGTMER